MSQPPNIDKGLFNDLNNKLYLTINGFFLDIHDQISKQYLQIFGMKVVSVFIFSL